MEKPTSVARWGPSRNGASSQGKSRQKGGAIYTRVPSTAVEANLESGNAKTRSQSSDDETATFDEGKIAMWIDEAMAQVAAFQQYAIICVVLSGFAFTALVSFDSASMINGSNFTYGGMHVGSSLVFCTTLSTTCCVGFGLHATLIFTLCSIYAATAVSHGDRNGFQEFMLNTHQIRSWAFRAFKGEIISMCVAIIFIVFSRLPLLFATLIMVPIAVLLGCGIWQSLQVIWFAKRSFRQSVVAQNGITHNRDCEAEDAEDSETSG